MLTSRSKTTGTANKTKTAIALFLVLTITASMTLQIANSHTPAWQIPTYAYITASPNPVGVGQTVTLVFWLDKVMPTAAGIAGDRWRNLKIEVTKPDGTKETLGPFTSDPVGSGWYQYTPTQSGTYTFVFTFPEQVLSRIGPTGLTGTTSVYENDTYLTSSATATLTVQEEAIPDPPIYPLPTEYWTRPIEGQNQEWYKVSSNWLAGAHVVQKVQMDGTAPNSPHIMWTKPIRDGGVVGGTRTGVDGITYYDGTQYEGQFQNPIVIHGRLYYTLPFGSTGGNGGYICVDLRTGETIWYNDKLGVSGSTAPSFGQLYDYESMNQHGAVPNGYLWTTNFANAYDPLTGKWLFNLTNVPSGTEVYGPNGEILRYVINVSGKWLALWNNTAAHNITGSTDPKDFTSTSFNQWRPIGKSVDSSDAYTWNVSIPWLPTGATALDVIYDDVLLGRNGSLPAVGTSWAPYTLWAISLKPTSRGSLLWMKTYDPPAGNLTRSFRFIDPVNRVFIFWDKETVSYSGYSLDDGSLLWTTPSENPFNIYAGGGGSIWTQTRAYGKLYSTGYSGMVYCYDTKTGRQVWNYSTATMAGFASPYPGYPLGVAAVADGKLYLHTNEHSCGAPYWKGAPLICLNATTGDEIWTIPFHGASGYVPWGYAVADGYFVGLNLFDEQIYCFGKGPSATTVEAPMTAVTVGTSAIIRGTVIDISAGTKQKEQAARFPNGVPAVSDASMSEWMQYVYMQKPCPTEVTGVAVSLNVLDANGNYRSIGTTTTDASGTFGFVWEPDISGKYTIIATFAGSESYWPSYAQTYAVAVEAPPATAAPEYPQPIDNTLTIIGVGIAMILALAIVGILLLRKK
ncbi:MAG: PQQ-binding-like beta-propeller repeat protein [Candidatus Bathyarchaeota archaeon]|nr:PQQ-binding-like beta-propeller repeat protein [Candidatus Bathyarchaeota archaeon]